jgi:hypothetical protein
MNLAPASTEGTMNVETATQIRARICTIEDQLREWGFGEGAEYKTANGPDMTEVAELYEERENLIQELALAAWDKLQ